MKKLMLFAASESIDDFVASLAKPRTAIVMVQAGPGTDAVIEQLVERFEPHHMGDGVDSLRD